MKSPSPRQQRLAEITVRELAEGKLPKKQELLRRTGYSPTNYEPFNTEGYNQAMIQALEDAGITDQFASKKLKKLLNNKNPQAVNNALAHYFKIKGSYAPTKQENTVKGEIIHSIKDDAGNYAEFLHTKRNTTDIQKPLKST